MDKDTIIIIIMIILRKPHWRFFFMCCLMFKIVWINESIKGILLQRPHKTISEIWKRDYMFKPRQVPCMEFFSYVCFIRNFKLYTGDHTQVFASTGKVSSKHNLNSVLKFKRKTRRLSSSYYSYRLMNITT